MLEAYRNPYEFAGRWSTLEHPATGGAAETASPASTVQATLPPWRGERVLEHLDGGQHRTVGTEELGVYGRFDWALAHG